MKRSHYSPKKRGERPEKRFEPRGFGGKMQYTACTVTLRPDRRAQKSFRT